MTRRFSLPASDDAKINLVLVVTGSVAAIKIPILVEALDRTRFNTILLPSSASLPFLPDLYTLHPYCIVFSDADEWRGWERGDDILHIELRKWADLVMLAPLSAHSLAKLSAGMCDTLGLEVLRAWDYTLHAPQISSSDLHPSSMADTCMVGSVNGEQSRSVEDGTNADHDVDAEVEEKTGQPQGWKEVVCAPAMNTCMYLHPLTGKQLRILRDELQYVVLGPITKTLACGDTGTGAMVEVQTLLEYCEAARLRMLPKKRLYHDTSALTTNGSTVDN